MLIRLGLIYQQEECGAHLRELFLTCTFSIPNRLHVKERPCHSFILCMTRMQKNQYMNRVLQLEKGSFVSLVFTTTGGMSPEVKSFIRRIAVLIATKTNEDYSQVMCNTCSTWEGKKGMDRPYIQCLLQPHTRSEKNCEG